MSIAPCRDCGQRHLKCHSTCEKYLEFRKELDMQNQYKREEQLKENDYWEYRRNLAKRAQNRRRN